MKQNDRHKPPVKASAIHLSGVSLRFEENGPALFDELSLNIEAGVCTCLLGPSGCGKSTLLRLISGSRIFKAEGKILFVPELSSQNGCAWMGQDDLLLPWMTLQDNVLLGARLRHEVTDTLRQKARGLIAEAGLAGYEKALPGTLSGGMRQRGALLRTLMEQRPILLMDEPFSALDALTRIKLQNLSSRMTKGATVILVTHDPMEALRMADRIIVLGGSPVKVAAVLSLSGTPPRRPDDPEITRHYSRLLNELMNEAVS